MRAAHITSFLKRTCGGTLIGLNPKPNRKTSPISIKVFENEVVGSVL